MADKVEKAYTAWRDAETAYAKALEGFHGGDRPGRIGLRDARELMELRARANYCMDRYFKKALD
jgi:hypothetical protein